jgi:hypothetical protein
MSATGISSRFPSRCGRSAFRRRTAWTLAGLALVLGGCASAEDWARWRQHPTHFASGTHYAFSARNRESIAPRLRQGDTAAATREGWWGQSVPAVPPMGVGGRWAGTWSGPGFLNEPRRGAARAEFAQTGAAGQGRLILEDVQGMEGVPPALRRAGSAGVPVTFEATDRLLVLTQADPGAPVRLVLTRQGERLVGRLPGGSVEVTIERVR